MDFTSGPDYRTVSRKSKRFYLAPLVRVYRPRDRRNEYIVSSKIDPIVGIFVGNIFYRRVTK